MPPRLIKLWASILSGLWFRPVLYLTTGIALGLVLPALDRSWPTLGLTLRSYWVSNYLPTTPDSSREVLIGMAAALVTVMTVAASMTMVAVQLASTQYTPRLLGRFMADHTTQRVLGTYLLTVVYLLLLLGVVGTQAKESEEVSLPVISLGVALALTLLCLLMLPYFLHHAAHSVEASTIIATIGREIIHELNQLESHREEELSETLPGPSEAATVFAARETGYVQLVDHARLLAALPKGVHTVRLDVRTGDFLFPGLPLLSLWPQVPLSERQQARLHAAFAVGHTRTTQQDVLYGVRQLVDMALKALSPAINDVTTAVMVVNELGAVGHAVAHKGWLGQGWWRRRHRGVTLLRPGFGLVPFLQDAFGEIPTCRQLAAASHRPRHGGARADRQRGDPGGDAGDARADRTRGVRGSTTRQPEGARRAAHRGALERAAEGGHPAGRPDLRDRALKGTGVETRGRLGHLGEAMGDPSPPPHQPCHLEPSMSIPPFTRWLPLLGLLLAACATSTPVLREDDEAPEVVSSWEEARADPSCVVPLCDEERCAIWRCQDLVEEVDDSPSVVLARGPMPVVGLRPPLVGNPSRWWAPPLAAPTYAEPVFEIPWHNWKTREQLAQQRKHPLGCMLPPEPLEKHHIFPQQEELARWFASKGIDIHDFTVSIPRSFHRWLHSGGPSGGQWNAAWRQFKEDNGRSRPEGDLAVRVRAHVLFQREWPTQPLLLPGLS